MSTGRRATVADVAKLAGVAPMTVSRVINGQANVSEELKQRVLEAVERVGYRPNALARGLRRSQSQVVGVLVPDIANPFCGELAKGIGAALESVGYRAFFTVADPRGEFEEAAIETLLDYQVAGVIVATRAVGSESDAVPKLARAGHKMVVIGRSLAVDEEGRAAVDSVTADFAAGGKLATEHLISLGHRAIGFLGISQESRSRLLRFEGYAEALQGAGLPLRAEWICGPSGDVAYATEADGYEGMKRLLGLRERPTALFARNDFVALGALRAARDAGCRVPEHVAIVGFDDVPLAAYSHPPLTTVRQPIAEQGAAAVRLLLERIEGLRTGEAEERRFACELVVRGSSGGVWRE